MQIDVVVKTSKSGNVYYAFRVQMEFEGQKVYKYIPILENDLLLLANLKKFAIKE